MANKKNTRTSTCRTTIASFNDPLGEERALMERIDGFFHLDGEAWADFDKFVGEQGFALKQEHELEEGDFDGGLAIAAWITSLVKDTERASQSQVNAAIRYLDISSEA